MEAKSSLQVLTRNCVLEKLIRSHGTPVSVQSVSFITPVRCCHQAIEHLALCMQPCLTGQLIRRVDRDARNSSHYKIWFGYSISDMLGGSDHIQGTMFCNDISLHLPGQLSLVRMQREFVSAHSVGPKDGNTSWCKAKSAISLIYCCAFFARWHTYCRFNTEVVRKTQSNIFSVKCKFSFKSRHSVYCTLRMLCS